MIVFMTVMQRTLAPALLLSLMVATLATVPPRAYAQAPSLQEMAIEWIRGRFGSPLLCQIGEKPIAGMRRMTVAPGARHLRPPQARIIFVGMELKDATRCFTDLEKSVPDIVGSLALRFPGAPRRDSSNRDFKAVLRRQGGLLFDIVGGVLRLREVGADPDELRDVDFRGGTASFLTVRPGSDSERMLSAITSPRKLDLIVKAPDGTRLRFPIFLVDTR